MLGLWSPQSAAQPRPGVGPPPGTHPSGGARPGPGYATAAAMDTCTGMARERVRWPSVVDRAREIVNGYAPMKVTLRQFMYRLASEGTLPPTAPMYRRPSA